MRYGSMMWQFDYSIAKATEVENGEIRVQKVALF